MSTPSGHLVLSLRDALREMRFAVRHEAGMIDRTIGTLGLDFRAKVRSATADLPHLHRALTALPTIEPQVLRLTDAVFGRLEKAAVKAFLPEDRTGAGGALVPIPTLMPQDGGSRRLDEAAFVQRHFRLAADVLRDLGVVNLLLSEQAIGAAGRMLESRHGDLVAGLSDRPVPDLSATERAQRIGVCAAMALTLERTRPVRRIDLAPGKPAPRHLLLAPNLYVFTLTALALAVVSTAVPDDADAADVIEAANTVVDVRFARFSAAARARDPLAAMTREFLAVVPHLP